MRKSWVTVKGYYRDTNDKNDFLLSLGQLYWREFFYLNGYKVPNFDRIAGNPLCRVIDWEYNPDYIKVWKEGRTGYPWIDACMKQLRQQGWLHHLARHSVACFLTRGDLYQSWEQGAGRFELIKFLFNPFQSSVALHIETSYLIYNANQMTGFYMKYSNSPKWDLYGVFSKNTSQ